MNMKIFVKVGKKESKFGEIIRQKGFFFFKVFLFNLEAIQEEFNGQGQN